MSDAEVITSALVAARFFGGNQELACKYLLEDGLIPREREKGLYKNRHPLQLVRNGSQVAVLSGLNYTTREIKLYNFQVDVKVE